ncbi:MAG: TIGR02266 family protein [Deltaproteobacteria bacterium]|nr:TIGR02266 family protein [Deltaproteobacteria bacterium]
MSTQNKPEMAGQAAVADMFPILREETYEDGDVIFKEGDPGKWVYIILSGAVSIGKKLMGEYATVEVMRKDEVFGEMAFVTGMPRSATALAMGRTTVGVVDPDALREEFKSLSPAMRKMFTSLAFRLKKTTDATAGVSYVRRYPRVLRTYYLTYQDGDDWLSGYTHDASCGGLFIKTDKPLEEGSEFLLSLSLPNEAEPVNIHCEVVWVRPPGQDSETMPQGMGVKFLGISKEDYDRLRVHVPDC